MRHTIFFLLFLNLTTENAAQNAGLGSWNIFNVRYNVDNKWSVTAEAQLRSLLFYDHFHYYEYKGIISYKAHKNLSLALGAGSYQTYQEGGDFVLPKNNNEFRLWPQITITQAIGKFNIEQRYRTELRFTSKGYRNRFRQRIGVAYPFGKEKHAYKPYQIAINNELFFTDKEPYFERNRFAITFNYKPSKMVTLQLGYLQQFDYKINDEIGRGFLQVGVFVELSKENF